MYELDMYIRRWIAYMVGVVGAVFIVSAAGAASHVAGAPFAAKFLIGLTKHAWSAHYILAPILITVVVATTYLALSDTVKEVQEERRRQRAKWLGLF